MGEAMANGRTHYSGNWGSLKMAVNNHHQLLLPMLFLLDFTKVDTVMVMDGLSFLKLDCTIRYCFLSPPKLALRELTWWRASQWQNWALKAISLSQSSLQKFWPWPTACNLQVKPHSKLLSDSNPQNLWYNKCLLFQPDTIWGYLLQSNE